MARSGARVMRRADGRPARGARRPSGLPRLRVSTPCLAPFERLPWTAGRVYLAYGVRLGIRVSDPAVLPLVETLLPPTSRRARGTLATHLVSWLVAGPRHGRRRHVLFAAGKPLLRTESRDVLLEAGFARVDVYWEGVDRNGEGNGIYRKVTRAENDTSWVAYVVGFR